MDRVILTQQKIICFRFSHGTEKSVTCRVDIELEKRFQARQAVE